MISYIIFLAFALSSSIAAQTVTISPGRQAVPVATPSVRLEFQTLVGLYYQIESSQDLKSWNREGYAFPGNGQRMSAIVSNHGLPRLFYRVGNNAQPADIAPVNPYGDQIPQGSPQWGSAMTATEFNPETHQLMVRETTEFGSIWRSISSAELAKIPELIPTWGAIKGSLPNQRDLISALDSKFSSANPPPWNSIIGTPGTLLGYGITDAVTTSTIGFMDRFVRYPDGTILLNNQSRPEIGNPWRYHLAGKSQLSASTISVSAQDSSFIDSSAGFLAHNIVVGDLFVMSGFLNAMNNGRFRVTEVSKTKMKVVTEEGGPAGLVDESAGAGRRIQGGYPPYLSEGALRAADKTLIYIGAPAPTRNGRFSITFEVELKPSIYPDGTYPAPITIGIKGSTLIPAQGGLNLGTLIHCQLNESGVQHNGIYGLGHTLEPEGGSHPVSFVPGKNMPRGVRHLINCKVEGDEMRVSGPGGFITYRDPLISQYIGDPETHWFYETAGDSLGANLYRNVWHLHRIWVNAPELDQARGWGLPDSAPTTPIAQLTLLPALGESAEASFLLSETPGRKLNHKNAHERIIIHGNFPNGNQKSLELRVSGEEIWNSGILVDTGEWTIEMDHVFLPDSTDQIHIRYYSEKSRRFGFHSGSGDVTGALSIQLYGKSITKENILLRAVLVPPNE